MVRVWQSGSLALLSSSACQGRLDLACRRKGFKTGTRYMDMGQDRTGRQGKDKYSSIPSCDMSPFSSVGLAFLFSCLSALLLPYSVPSSLPLPLPEWHWWVMYSTSNTIHLPVLRHLHLHFSVYLTSTHSLHFTSHHCPAVYHLFPSPTTTIRKESRPQQWRYDKLDVGWTGGGWDGTYLPTLGRGTEVDSIDHGVWAGGGRQAGAAGRGTFSSHLFLLHFFFPVCFFLPYFPALSSCALFFSQLYILLRRYSTGEEWDWNQGCLLRC
ncbi:hypothetical protein B0T20DRAFT_412300 [Sordaria brevicollis]|uniref:Uncharacterized protein n=1 Tax=Sordaria brevicollis TaxID=83679 RepID=A0AAE0PCP3_SORBR|nr:hypothetical protein B0T20DRAFT_412300 [Sordaria brevicollis]